MKIFDLNKKVTYKKDELQNNIKDLKKKFGNRFIIKYKKYKLPVRFITEHLKLVGLSYLSLQYDIKKQTDYLLPFRISFVDSDGGYKLNNNAYIANIHKTKDISGSQMVEFVLELLRKLGANRASLHDGAEVKCGDFDMGLSFFKLIEKKRGFYEKFGFKLTTQLSNYGKKEFPNNSTMFKLLYNTIDEFKKIKLDYYKNTYIKILEIIFDVIKKQDYHKVDISILTHIDIQNKNDPSILYIKSEDIKGKLLNLVKECDIILGIIKNTKHKYLYKLMIELFNDQQKCKSYIDIMNYIIHNQFYMIKYGKRIVKLENKFVFSAIFQIKNLAKLYYQF